MPDPFHGSMMQIRIWPNDTAPDQQHCRESAKITLRNQLYLKMQNGIKSPKSIFIYSYF